MKKAVLFAGAGALVAGFFLLRRLRKVNPKGKHIMIVGDSQSAYAGGWQDQLKAMYKFDKLTNLSQGGKQTGWLLANRVKPYFANKTNPIPDVLIIWGGSGNDCDSMVSPAKTYANVQQQVDIAKAAGVKDIFVFAGFDRAKTIVPTNPYWSKLPAPYQQAKNRANCTSLSKGFPGAIKGAVVIPMFTGVGPNSTQDGIHLKIRPDMTNLAKYIGSKVFV